LSRIGLLGGTFSPPTNAHLSIASFAKSQFSLDFIYVIPCSVPTIGKSEKPIESHHRFNMCVLACFGKDWLRISDMELQTEPVYSYQTLNALTKKHEGSKLFFIGGTDALSNIDKWRNPDICTKLADFIIVPRNGNDVDAAVAALKTVGKTDDGINVLDFPKNEMSSTMARQRLRSGMSCDYLVPDAVLGYIDTNRLYKEEETGTC
jgi:nicotinate-nucleotide adenylyltransferase